MRGDTVSFESMERRQLFSTINVASFGARPNDGGNDLPAIEAAMRASKPGDTILFNGGTFDLSGFNHTSGGNGMTVLVNRTYKGINGATLRGHDSKGPQFYIHGDNVSVTGLTFDGGGIKVDGNNAMAQNITIDNNVFKLNTSGENRNGITANSGLRNSRITNNYFTGYTGTFGIYGYNYNGLTIANNEFVNITAGIHIDAFGGCGNLLVEQNYITGVKGMGMEFQTQGGGENSITSTNVVFQDNWYEHPNLSSDKTRNTYSMAFSLILDRGSNETIRRNVVIAPERADGIGTRIGFEVGGDNTLVEDNYINGVNHTVAVNDGHGTCSVTVQNNKFMNYLEAPSLSFPAPGRSWKNLNNNPNVTLSKTMAERISKQIKPGRNHRLGVEIKKSIAKPQVAHPDVAKPAATSVFLSDLKWNSAQSGWGPVERDQSVGGKAFNDGEKITIDGHTYKKGLAAAADSEIVYNLSGKYTSFLSNIGVDDQAGKKGSVKFQVFADGKQIYDSGVMRGSDPAKKVSLDVDSVKQLRLVVTSAGDGGNSDLADWASARLTS